MTEIRDIDLADEDLLHRWWEIHHDAQNDRPLDYTTPWAVARVGLRTPHPDFRIELLGAYEGDRMVGAGLVNLPMTDNLRTAYIDVYVDWPARRQGVGTLLVDEVERRARAADREHALVEVFAPPGATSAGSAFADARGYVVANREGTKAIDLAAAEADWDALEAEVDGARGDFRVVTWEGACPDEYLEDLGAMLSGFIAMVPTGELEIEDGEWTPARLRESERRAAEIGQTRFYAAGESPEGTLVGVSDVRVSQVDPGIGYIGLTMVMPEARGHRLGLGMKLATHRAVRAAYPACTAVVTSNADVNAHMNAVNQALGYRVLEQLLEYQKRL